MRLFESCFDCILLQGECTPYLRTAGLTSPQSGSGSDLLDERHARHPGCELLQATMMRDLGAPCREWRCFDEADYVRHVAWRLGVQWPNVTVDIADVAAVVRRSVEAVFDSTVPDIPVALLQMQLVDRLADIVPGFVRSRYDGYPAARGVGTMRPAIDVVVEEPPFLVPRPWQHATTLDLAIKPVLLKSPSSAYRLPFWRAVFPCARFRLLHIVRNPAASINGLIDGWASDLFHSHHIPGLDIVGYSDRRCDGAWWKFDLPPAWPEYATRSLDDVCVFQWLSAHRHVLDYVRRQRLEANGYLRLHFEDFLGDDKGEALHTLSRWFGLTPRDEGDWAMPRVMCTAAPRPMRWHVRKSRMEVVSRIPCVRELALRLGCGADLTTWV